MHIQNRVSNISFNNDNEILIKHFSLEKNKIIFDRSIIK